MRQVSCNQSEAPDASRFHIRLSGTQLNRLKPETILRWSIYLHLLAILVCVGMILEELAYRGSDGVETTTLSISLRSVHPQGSPSLPASAV